MAFSSDTYVYRHRRDSQLAIRQRLRELAQTLRRFGCKRLHIMLRRVRWQVIHNRVYRLYSLEGLKCNLVSYAKGPLAKPQKSNEKWTMEFMHDELGGRGGSLGADGGG